MRAVIGITCIKGSVDQQVDVFSRAVAGAGAVPLFLPIPTEPEGLGPALGALNGLLVTGEDRDLTRPEQAAEAELVRLALRQDLPVLAVGGGLLFLNSVLGGENLSLGTGATGHHQGSLPGNLAWHSLKVDPWSCLATYMGGSRFDVNSFHRVAVARPGVGLAVVGWSQDGAVEAVESRAHSFVVGIQFRPELMAESHQRVFRAFRRSAESHRQRKRKLALAAQ
ncbi:MAG: gamma-glutamyl-gamma-aminobutyrate hydrolase family protein [Bacillota bacterium]